MNSHSKYFVPIFVPVAVPYETDTKENFFHM